MAKVKVYLCLLPSSGLPSASNSPKRIGGLYGIIAVDAGLGAGGAFQPITVEKCTVAKERADPPAVDGKRRPCRRLRQSCDRLPSSPRRLKLWLFFHRKLEAQSLFPAPMPMVASWARIALKICRGWRQNCRAKSRYSKKFFFTSSLSTFGKSTVGAAGGAGCSKEGRKRPCFVNLTGPSPHSACRPGFKSWGAKAGRKRTASTNGTLS